jgi:hypothetical protein
MSDAERYRESSVEMIDKFARASTLLIIAREVAGHPALSHSKPREVGDPGKDRCRSAAGPSAMAASLGDLAPLSPISDIRPPGISTGAGV